MSVGDHYVLRGSKPKEEFCPQDVRAVTLANSLNHPPDDLKNLLELVPLLTPLKYDPRHLVTTVSCKFDENRLITEG